MTLVRYNGRFVDCLRIKKRNYDPVKSHQSIEGLDLPSFTEFYLVLPSFT